MKNRVLEVIIFLWVMLVFAAAANAMLVLALDAAFWRAQATRPHVHYIYPCPLVKDTR